jgi:Ca2+-binding RTX toxin-like protein
MRRVVLLSAMVALGVLLACGVALAATINCPNRAGNLCVGTDNRNFMYGTSAKDVMRGLGAADTLRARAGADRLAGGDGGDKLAGGRGSDVYAFRDEWGRDLITSRERAGVDALDFTGINDVLQVSLAGETAVTAWNNPGRLGLAAGIVIENVRGTPRETSIYGNGAPNHFWGNTGQDFLSSRVGNDTVTGGLGPDWLDGGTDNDALNGGDGTDYYIFTQGWGQDSITAAGAPGEDAIRFDAALGDGVGVDDGVDVDLVAREDAPEVSSGANTVNFPPSVVIGDALGLGGNDVLRGNAEDNLLSGHSGNDELAGRAGSDLLVDSRQGDETLRGGPGTDTFRAGGGNDTIHALDGEADKIYCADGIDTVHYDQGLDTFRDGSTSPPPSCETTLTT